MRSVADGLTGREENRGRRHSVFWSVRSCRVPQPGSRARSSRKDVRLGKPLGGITVLQDSEKTGALVVWTGHWEEVPAPR